MHKIRLSSYWTQIFLCSPLHTSLLSLTLWKGRSMGGRAVSFSWSPSPQYILLYLGLSMLSMGCQEDRKHYTLLTLLSLSSAYTKWCPWFPPLQRFSIVQIQRVCISLKGIHGTEEKKGAQCKCCMMQNYSKLGDPFDTIIILKLVLNI